jgi:hypothetical protein
MPAIMSGLLLNTLVVVVVSTVDAVAGEGKSGELEKKVFE